MRVFKFVAGFICGIVILLSFQKSMVDNLGFLMCENIGKGLTTPYEVQRDQEVDEDFLILLDIQSGVSRLEELSRIVIDEIEGSPSEITELRTVQMEQFMQRMEQLITEASRDVSLLMLTNVKDLR